MKLSRSKCIRWLDYYTTAVRTYREYGTHQLQLSSESRLYKRGLNNSGLSVSIGPINFLRGLFDFCVQIQYYPTFPDTSTENTLYE